MPRPPGLNAVSSDALAAPILILGAPRSGTTWLAKIIDSHPDVIYRHEPDMAVPPPSPLSHHPSRIDPSPQSSRPVPSPQSSRPVPPPQSSWSAASPQSSWPGSSGPPPQPPASPGGPDKPGHDGGEDGSGSLFTPVNTEPDDLPALLARWANETGARTVTKRPHFAKSWQRGWARHIRTLLCAATRFPVLAGMRIPDLAFRPAPRLAIKSIAWAEGAAILAQSLPASRTIFLLRHPCGQVASVMRGNKQQRFDLKTAGTDMPFDEERTLRYAKLPAPAFDALPDAAKYAWAWRAFNEPAYAALAAQRNVHVILYEALCAEPNPMARRILDFAGLDWNPQTEDFVARSTRHDGQAGYYGVFRNAVVAAENWRKTMPSPDQAAVRSVIASSPLARFWPDLMSGT